MAITWAVKALSTSWSYCIHF